ncbi:MAG TPA: NAD(P)(+) transhydrogenase (Re/Si-specific) subunit alpha, partial [Chitinophagaceae bacterium]|nr:NAD(P)(+) transhydrogenase (Re/Si-specific) subunit alpha [Chitinophagaceae bacterium]
MTIGLLKEPAPESRVSLLAEAVATLTKKGITVLVEKSAGEKAFCNDSEYEKAGASIRDAHEVVSISDIILSIHQPNAILQVPSSKILVGVYQPLYNAGTMSDWASKGLPSFSLDMLPRTTRAQSMD